MQSDHESTELAEAKEKRRFGMHVLLREGSTERNLATLLPLVNAFNAMTPWPCARPACSADPCA